MAKIEVISSCLVGMANNNATSRMELTPWDLRLLYLRTIQRGLLFHNPKSQDFRENFIHHLKSSLARTLDFFPPLAGRLGTVENVDNTVCFFINCNNAGAGFTHATARDISLSDILEPTYIPKFISSFFPVNGYINCEGISKPLLGVQVTELADGYFIGCTANHAVVDGTSFWHFMNSWSEISRGFSKISKTPIFERWFPSNISPNNHHIPLPPLEQNLHNTNTISAPPLLERVFHFSEENIAKLKAKANREAGTDKISSLQALSAHVWRSVIRSKKNATHCSNENQEICCIFPVGTRARLALPDGYFGNAVYGARFYTNEMELLQRGLGWAALKLNELVARQTREEASKFVEEWVKNPEILRIGVSSFVIGGSPRYNVYDSDFGWGKPVAGRSGSAQKLDGIATAYPAAPESGGGIDIEVCLVHGALLTLGEDAEFMEFVTN